MENKLLYEGKAKKYLQRKIRKNCSFIIKMMLQLATVQKKAQSLTKAF